MKTTSAEYGCLQKIVKKSSKKISPKVKKKSPKKFVKKMVKKICRVKKIGPNEKGKISQFSSGQKRFLEALLVQQGDDELKDSTLPIWYLKSNCFRSFFRRIKKTFQN